MRKREEKWRTKWNTKAGTYTHWENADQEEARRRGGEEGVPGLEAEAINDARAVAPWWRG